MRWVPGIVYLGFLAGAAIRSARLVMESSVKRLRDTYYPPREYTVALFYTKSIQVPTGTGDHRHQMAVSINSGLSRTFVCKRAYCFFDVTLILRERMNRYIVRHYGKLGLGFNFYADYTHLRMDPSWKANLMNIECYDMDCIIRAFAAMPREL